MDRAESAPFLKEQSDVEEVTIVQRPRHHRTLLQVLTKGLVFVFATWGCLSVLYNAFHMAFPGRWTPFMSEDVYRPETLPPGTTECSCGSTVDEAIELGCVYDTLATAWLPPRCRDDALTAEFDMSGPLPNGQWGYYADENATIPLTKSDLGDLARTGTPFWASRDWHIAHCVFYWQKFWRMKDTGAVMEKRFDSLHHVRHCGKLIRAPVPDFFFLLEVPVRMGGGPDHDTESSRVGGVLPGHYEELGAGQRVHPEDHETMADSPHKGHGGHENHHDGEKESSAPTESHEHGSNGHGESHSQRASST